MKKGRLQYNAIIVGAPNLDWLTNCKGHEMSKREDGLVGLSKV